MVRSDPANYSDSDEEILYSLEGFTAVVKKNLTSNVKYWSFMSYSDYRPKDVFVRPYIRVRFGNLEDVCQHWRGHPNQLTLFN